MFSLSVTSFFIDVLVVQFQNEFSDYIADIWKNLYPELTKCEEDLMYVLLLSSSIGSNNSIMNRSFASIYIDKTTHAISIHNFSESNRQVFHDFLWVLSSICHKPSINSPPTFLLKSLLISTTSSFECSMFF